MKLMLLVHLLAFAILTSLPNKHQLKEALTSELIKCQGKWYGVFKALIILEAYVLLLYVLPLIVTLRRGK